MSRLALLLRVEHRVHARAFITARKPVNANGSLPSYTSFCWTTGVRIRRTPKTLLQHAQPLAAKNMRETATQIIWPSGALTIAPMSLERPPLESDDAATQHDWFAPLAAFIAWLAHLFDQIAKLKRIRRTTKFKPNWRDHWRDLRQCEWMRDQILASGAAQLLAGKALDLDAFIPSTEPPANYGGPCPATPFEMNRRFLAIARFNADPEPAIRAHAARIARRPGIDLNSPLRLAGQATSPGFAGGGLNACWAEKSSLADRRGRWIATSASRDGGGCARARGPPPLQFAEIQQSKTSHDPPARSRPRAQH
jgi:hypothetical protein